MILSSAYFGLISLKSVYEFLIVNNDEINFGKFVAYNENNANIIQFLLENMSPNAAQDKYFDEKLEINIRKNIPYSSGLGGGSSNSASVIKGLNQFLKLNLDSKEMFDIALKFGSDIPFFLSSLATCCPVSRLISLSFDIPPDIINIFFFNLF